MGSNSTKLIQKGVLDSSGLPVFYMFTLVACAAIQGMASLLLQWKEQQLSCKTLPGRPQKKCSLCPLNYHRSLNVHLFTVIDIWEKRKEIMQK